MTPGLKSTNNCDVGVIVVVVRPEANVFEVKFANAGRNLGARERSASLSNSLRRHFPIFRHSLFSHEQIILAVTLYSLEKKRTNQIFASDL